MGAIKGQWPRRGLVQLLSVLTLLMAVLVGAGGPAAAAAKTPPGDPPGNNGTVKIERDGPNDPDRSNEPHVDGCIVWLEYYGFDQGQTADITFTSQAPSTPTGKVLVADKAVTVSDTPAGGGKDRDYVLAYNLTSAVQGLKANPKQGYHIKLSSDSLQAPGGSKHKVFWIKCAPKPTTTLRISKALQGAPGPAGFAFSVSCNHRPIDTTFTLDAGKNFDLANVPAGTTCAVTETDKKGAQATTAAEDPPDSVPNDGVAHVGDKPVAVVFTNVFPGSGNTPAPDNSDLRAPAGASAAAGTTGSAGTTPPSPNTAVLGATATRPAPSATLPRTGDDPAPLTALGLWSLSAGGLALAGGRRRLRR